MVRYHGKEPALYSLHEQRSFPSAELASCFGGFRKEGKPCEAVNYQ
jgi:hypothetical protein